MTIKTAYRKSDGSVLLIEPERFDPELMSWESLKADPALPPDKPAAPEAPTDPDERLAAIRDAISQLDPENPELYGKSGKPHVEAIEAILGWNISAAERDEAVD